MSVGGKFRIEHHFKNAYYSTLKQKMKKRIYLHNISNLNTKIIKRGSSVTNYTPGIFDDVLQFLIIYDMGKVNPIFNG